MSDTASYVRNQLRSRTRLAKMYESQVKAAIKSQMEVVASQVKTYGPEFVRKRLDSAHLNPRIGPVIKDLYNTAAQMANKNFEVKAGAALGSDLQFIAEVLDYLEKFLLDKVVLPISDTTTAELERILDEGIAKGWGVDKIVAEIENSDIPKWRSRMIVRTESVRAMNATQTMAAEKKEYEVDKQWIAVDDNRTRHSHREVDGERIPIDQTYSNGCKFPGDPDADAAETINCRCTQGFFARRDVEGNIVAKE